MKTHRMEVHHEVFQEDPDWIDLLVDKTLLSEMKCVAEDEKLQIKCPLCSHSRDDIHALKYHIKTAHKKNKREVEDLVELRELGTKYSKRAKYSNGEGAGLGKPKSENGVNSATSNSGVTSTKSDEIQAPILPSTLVEDESHFLLSRTISTSASPENDSSVMTHPNNGDDSSPTKLPQSNSNKNREKLPKSNSTVEKCYVCLCGQRFDDSMSLAVHCHLVNHKFNEYIIDGKIDKETDPSQRKKILMQTQPV
jgi:hypothetical protein